VLMFYVEKSHVWSIGSCKYEACGIIYENIFVSLPSTIQSKNNFCKRKYLEDHV
jgi:hypothetical protein